MSLFDYLIIVLRYAVAVLGAVLLSIFVCTLFGFGMDVALCLYFGLFVLFTIFMFLFTDTFDKSDDI